MGGLHSVIYVFAGYRFPKLKLVADLSHWINVAETNTTDPDLTQVIEDLAPQVYLRKGHRGCGRPFCLGRFAPTRIEAQQDSLRSCAFGRAFE